MTPFTLLDYYQKNAFNPVPIDLGGKDAWKSHLEKRFNLYQRHLGIPIALLRGKSILEFGCNSGENALALASIGANLTLVEPNNLVIPRLNETFERYGLTDRVAKLTCDDIASFESDSGFDVVLAEGFLFALSDREPMLRRLSKFLNPGGLAVVSYNDRTGSLMEMTKRLLLFRANRLAGTEDPHERASLKMAEQLFGPDFAMIRASRPFEAWWKDTLVSPFFGSSTHWSYDEILSIVEESSCEFYSSSPKWSGNTAYDWYKNVGSPAQRREELAARWRRDFTFFLTGVARDANSSVPATKEVIRSTSELATSISTYTTEGPVQTDPPEYPRELFDYLAARHKKRLTALNEEMNVLYKAMGSASLEELIDTYHQSQVLRKTWGTPYHYLCYTRPLQ